MAKPNHSQPAKPGLPPPRTPTPRPQVRVSVTRVQPVQSVKPSPKLPEHHYEAQRHWFDHEVRTLRQLAQTERLTGDYVAAQRLERELDSFIREASALLEQEGSK